MKLTSRAGVRTPAPFLCYPAAKEKRMASLSISDRSNELLAAGRHRDAARLLDDAARAGDGAALFQLALWRVRGDILRRDLSVARDLLFRAGAAGVIEAALLHTYFVANGTGGVPDWPAARNQLAALCSQNPAAARQERLLAAMDLDEEGFPARISGRKILSAAPEIAVIPSFLSDAECAYLIAVAAPLMVESTVIDPASGRVVSHPVRRSDYSLFGVFHEDMVVGAINRRIAALTGTMLPQGETLQVLRYRPGGEYRAHFDALPATGNQRILTVLAYLNDDYEGGATAFTRTGFSFRGDPGDALVFRNVDAEGQLDPLTQHAGLQVTRGTKFLASRWIRAAAFTFPSPTPLLPE